MSTQTAPRSDVAEFYRNKNIFLTGGTGFLGLTLIDKILRSLPEVGTLEIIFSAFSHLSNLAGQQYLPTYESEKGEDNGRTFGGVDQERGI